MIKLFNWWVYDYSSGKYSIFCVFFPAKIIQLSVKRSFFTSWEFSHKSTYENWIKVFFMCVLSVSLSRKFIYKNHALINLLIIKIILRFLLFRVSKTFVFSFEKRNKVLNFCIFNAFQNIYNIISRAFVLRPCKILVVILFYSLLN